MTKVVLEAHGYILVTVLGMVNALRMVTSPRVADCHRDGYSLRGDNCPKVEIVTVKGIVTTLPSDHSRDIEC